ASSGRASRTGRSTTAGSGGRDEARALRTPEWRLVARRRRQLLGDDEQPVVLRGALGTRRSARLDLTGAGRDGEIGNERVLGLAGAMRDDVAVPRAGCTRHRRARLRQRPYLIHLDEDRVGEAVRDALGEELLVGAEEVVAHQLHAAAQRRGEGLPSRTVVLAEAVLDRHDRVARTPAVIERDQVVGRAPPATCLAEHVPVAVGELAGCTVERDRDVPSGLEACRADRLLEQIEGLLVALERGSEAALVADRGRQRTPRQLTAERMVDLDA